MPRKLYVTCFGTFAAIFVRDVFDFGMVSYIVPPGWMAISVGRSLLGAKFVHSLWALSHLAIYLLAFYGFARATFWVSMHGGSPRSR